MSTAPVTPKLAIVTAGEPTLFDSLARLVPEELQAAYYRVLAHTRTLSPDDEMLRILEAMGILALLTRHTPKDIADERERFQEILELHRRSSDEAQEKMREYLRGLESRISTLPSEIEAGLDPKEIAKMLGESLRQHFLRSGVQDTVSALQTTSTAMTSAQKELAAALRALSDSHGGVGAQVERANNRIAYTLESRSKTMDALLHEWKSDLLRIWIPMVAAASMLIGLFGGIEIQGCRDSAPPAGPTPTQSAVPTIPSSPEPDPAAVENPNQRTRSHEKANASRHP
ncbi:MAG TPA: hypothetical protein VHX20_08715 [Terracidiphilus sp.]|jgi:predicted secreted protein|nr:hypothetical protein [Terracidiphilus sp.]